MTHSPGQVHDPEPPFSGGVLPILRARRCSAVVLEPRETAGFDLDALFQGGSGLQTTIRWMALAPHLDDEHEVGPHERELLGSLDSLDWLPMSDLRTRFGAGTVDRLLALGLLIGDGAEHADARGRDERFRATHWHTLTAVSHAFGRWRDVDSSNELETSGLRSLRDLVDKLGEPPTHLLERVEASARIPLPRAEASALSELMRGRTTCRNFDTARMLPAALFASLLDRVFAAQSVHALTPRTAVLKKNSPSGGGLHPTECYLLVQHVDGVAPGLYHYHAGEHALEPLPGADGMDATALAALAQRLVAGQYWFADAHVLALLVPRFERSFWKYRNHSKAYRALILDAGHLSQNVYLAATELGLGAYITAAINEIEIERVFGLDGLKEGPLAVCGFGWRSAEKDTPEFDPLGRVWPR